MPTLHFFKKNRPSIQVKEGSNLRQSLLDQNVPVASSCGGDGVCSKCWIKIIDGEQNLSSVTKDELLLKIISTKPISTQERLSCTTLVNGDIVIDTPYW